MSTQAGEQATRARRRPGDVLLLVVNLAVLVFGVSVVWIKIRDGSGRTKETPVLDTGALQRPPGEGSGGNGEAGGDARGTPSAGNALGRSETGNGAAEHEDAVSDGAGSADSPGMRDVSVPTNVARSDEPPAPPRLRGRVDDRTEGAALPPVPAPRRVEALHALAATETAIDRVGVDLEVLHTIRGAYPTSSADYGANRGIEALVVALAKVGKSADLRLGDTDDDGRLEILDAWGRPLVYFSPDDYDSVQHWAPGDGEATEVRARRSAATGAFRAATNFQLFSVGPDGRPAARDGDDVTSWVSRD